MKQALKANTRNQSSVFADASQSQMIANQQKLRNARNANMLISDVQLKKDYQKQMVTEA